MKTKISLIVGIVSLGFVFTSAFHLDQASADKVEVTKTEKKSSKAAGKAAKGDSKAAKSGDKSEKSDSKGAGSVQKISISTKGDEYYFDKDKISAKAGQAVQITFTNKSSKDSGLQHNLVVVKPGTIDAVATAGISAGADKGWVPQGSPDIVIHTKLLNPGESETLSFQAPSEPGEYPYVCTFPGHSATMRGVLTVTK